MKEYLGKRILFKMKEDGIFECIETVVKEVSPNGLFVNLSGDWFRVQDVVVLDVLNGGVNNYTGSILPS